MNIYQINTDRDPKQLKFLCLDTARRILHSAEPDSAAYDKVYSGDVKCRNLEDVFTLFNSRRPEGFRGHSLSVSDVVEVVLRRDSISVTALDSRKFLFSRSLPPTPSGVLPSKWFWWNPERRHGSRKSALLWTPCSRP